MNETRSDHDDLKASMRQTLRLISNIARTSRWKLFHDDTAGWSFTDGHGGYYDGADTAPRSRADVEDEGSPAELDAAWEAIEKSTDPRDVALMKRIRERIREKDSK